MWLRVQCDSKHAVVSLVCVCVCVQGRQACAGGVYGLQICTRVFQTGLPQPGKHLQSSTRGIHHRQLFLASSPRPPFTRRRSQGQMSAGLAPSLQLLARHRSAFSLWLDADVFLCTIQSWCYPAEAGVHHLGVLQVATGVPSLC